MVSKQTRNEVSQFATLLHINASIFSFQQPKSLTDLIKSVARELATSQSLIQDAPSLLLQIKARLTGTPLGSKALEEVYVSMWRSDLLHVLIEVLREDFSVVDGQWSTAAELASLLAKMCAFIKHKEPNTAVASPPGWISSLSLDSFTDDEIEEYYEILLPTATDSFLILANHIYDNVETGDSAALYSTDSISALALVNLEHFKLVLVSLNRVCSVHTQCISRVIHSPYLLHLLVTDYRLYAVQVLNLLHDVISAEKDLPVTEELQSILDELVFKIGGNDESLALSSLSLLALVCGINKTMVSLICDKYKGMSVLIEKWRHSFDGELKNFAQTLLQSVKGSEEDHVQNRAAVMIQAGWRGYCERNKMLRARRGIIRFQRLFRKRRAEKLKRHMNVTATVVQHGSVKIRASREMLEKEKQMLEQMPANSVTQFIAQQRKHAAVKIQSWWRKRLTEKNKNSNIELVKMQDLTKRNDTATSSLGISSMEVKEHDESSIVSESDLLEWFYRSRPRAKEADRRHSILIEEVYIALDIRDTYSQYICTYICIQWNHS